MKVAAPKARRSREKLQRSDVISFGAPWVLVLFDYQKLPCIRPRPEAHSPPGSHSANQLKLIRDGISCPQLVPASLLSGKTN